MNFKIKKRGTISAIFVVFLLVFTVFPSLSFATVTCDSNGYVSGSLVPCGNDCNNDGVVKNMTGGGLPPGTDHEECTFDTLVTLAQNVINFLIFWLAAPIAAVMFMYAGFLMLTNNGNEAKVTQAKAIFGMVFWGLVVTIAAWLIITFILDFFRVGSGFRQLI